MASSEWADGSGRGDRALVDGRVRLYENRLLEALSRAHPAIPVCLWGPLSLGSILLGFAAGLSGWQTAGLVLAGLFGWTLCEYVLHRWIFHWVPENRRLRRFFYPMHELHHEVQERDRLVTPPLMSVTFWIPFFALFWLLLGWPALFPFTGGFTIGYLCYDYVHYRTHFGTPRTRIGKGLRRRHLQHHFAHGDRWYGVSSPLWDYVFRTHLRPGERPRRSA